MMSRDAVWVEAPLNEGTPARAITEKVMRAALSSSAPLLADFESRAAQIQNRQNSFALMAIEHPSVAQVFADKFHMNPILRHVSSSRAPAGSLPQGSGKTAIVSTFVVDQDKAKAESRFDGNWN